MRCMKRIMAFIIILFSLSCGFSSGTEAQILFEDDFNDNINNWPIADDNNIILEMKDGKYVFGLKLGEGWWNVFKSVPIDQNQDFQIEAIIRKTKGVNDYGYGIEWGRKDDRNLYYFVVSGDGHYCYGKKVNDQWHDILVWPQSNAVNKYDSTNKLAIQKVGEQLKFFINDQYVNTVKFESFIGTWVGFILNRQMKVEIDHFLVKQSSSIESDQTSPLSKKKVALVIGNSDYTEAPLQNPGHDAEDITKILQMLGFTVTAKININQQQMENAVTEFVKQIQNGDIALFYFSGHGVQVKGENYLLPVGVSFQSESDIRYKAVNAGYILGRMEESGNRTNIFILDACRNNPFKGLRSLSKGLIMMDAPGGTFIAYATAPGTAAEDGVGRNSPYTKHLIAALKIKGIPIEQTFKQVLREVEQETEGRQIPWTSSSLREDFYFNP